MHLIDKSQFAGTDAMLLSVDAEKAFDRVNWGFLDWTLAQFGIGERFRAWVASCYDCPQATIRVKGTNSRPFDIRRGTRQGCPLSPLLFALYIEPLAQKIRTILISRASPFMENNTRLAYTLMISWPPWSLQGLRYTLSCGNWRHLGGCQGLGSTTTSPCSCHWGAMSYQHRPPAQNTAAFALTLPSHTWELH